MTQSIRSRFCFSAFANLSKALISFCTGLLVARGLGTEQYGTMVFLLGTFTATRHLFDVGTSTAFFTFLSQRQRSLRFVGFYFSWLGLQFFVTLVAVGLLFPASWIDLIWRGEQRNLVILAFLAAYVQSVLWSAFLQMGESQRLTRWVQGVAVTVAAVHFFLMALAWLGHWLSICTILILLIAEWLVAVVLIAKQLHFSPSLAEADTPKSVLCEFWRYCTPLVLYSWLGFAYEFADRWLLQTYAGSVQQAYYAVAYQFAAIAAIATTSILNIFWKEIAEAHDQNNHERVAILYQRVSRGLFFVAAIFAGFLAPWAADILRITLGGAYVGGAATLMLMFFYPMHQSMGQIGGTMAYATGRVALQVKIGMAFMAVSIAATYFALAEANAPLPGLGLGSLGLAGKMVVMQILGVNALAFYLSRSLGIKFDWRFQFTATLLCIAAGLMAHAVSHTLFDVTTQIWVALPLAGVLYLILILIFVWISPTTAGLSKSDLTLVTNRLRLVQK